MTDEEVFRHVERELMRIAGVAANAHPRHPYRCFLRELGGEEAAKSPRFSSLPERLAAALDWRTKTAARLARVVVERLPAERRTLVAIADVLELPR